MAIPARKLSIREFIESEELQPDRDEFVHGKVFAMVGAPRSHGAIVSNLVRALGNHFAGSPCRVFCDDADLRTEQIFRSPLVVAEVLSPSIYAYDRSSMKFALYRRIPSLREYVLVDTESRRNEAFRVGADSVWVLHDMSEGPAMSIPAIDATILMAEVFAGVDAV